MFTSPVWISLTTILTATSLSVMTLMPSIASALTQPISADTDSASQIRPGSVMNKLGGFSQPGWLIADDDDDDDDDNFRQRGRYRGGDDDDDDDDDDRGDRRAVVTLQKAKNLARQAAERANGGLRYYRAEASMYGPASEAPCVDNGDSWTFTFLGGAPGWKTATIESIITVAKTSNRIRIDYNGPVRTVRPINRKGLLRLGRLVNQNALVLQLNLLEKPITNSAFINYQIFARRNNRWVLVYRTTATRIVTTAGRINLQPVVIPLNQLQLGSVDWSRLELKTVAQMSYGQQQVVVQEVVQRFQAIAQITNVQQVYALPIFTSRN